VSASDFASGIPRRKFKHFPEYGKGNVRDFDAGNPGEGEGLSSAIPRVAVEQWGLAGKRRRTLRKALLLIEKNGKRMRGEHVGEMVFNLLQ
jgi:hypothetical protein